MRAFFWQFLHNTWFITSCHFCSINFCINCICSFGSETVYLHCRSCQYWKIKSKSWYNLLIFSWRYVMKAASCVIWVCACMVWVTSSSFSASFELHRPAYARILLYHESFLAYSQSGNWNVLALLHGSVCVMTLWCYQTVLLQLVLTLVLSPTRMFLSLVYNLRFLQHQ
jgi:hypothetical protein